MDKKNIKLEKKIDTKTEEKKQNTLKKKKKVKKILHLE